MKRILALGALLPRIRTPYRGGEIDAATVRHLTLASKSQQTAWLGAARRCAGLLSDRSSAQGMAVRRQRDCGEACFVRRRGKRRRHRRRPFRRGAFLRRQRCLLDRADGRDRGAQGRLYRGRMERCRHYSRAASGSARADYAHASKRKGGTRLCRGARQRRSNLPRRLRDDQGSGARREREWIAWRCQSRSAPRLHRR